jgi:hypothetical protein
MNDIIFSTEFINHLKAKFKLSPLKAKGLPYNRPRMPRRGVEV